ncbi:MAG: 3-methylornithine--L-lysine ligase PylC [Thermoplasmatales archaeon]|nr:3-methylornithine--L-lysine ligase PylC [Thermoplasmatales archaeon]
MRICLVGGALQGMEAAYLARRAGYETLVIDRREDAPAFSLADGCAVLDPIESPREALALMGDCDAVLPTCENLALLECLSRLLSDYGGRFLFDIDAYRISRSKAESNAVMSRLGVPMPAPWPECGFPAVVKPSVSSGSEGVALARDAEGLARGIAGVESSGGTPVVQEYVDGTCVSMEFIGDGKEYAGYVTTEIIAAKDYDCKRVECRPGILPPGSDTELRGIGLAISAHLGLDGILDLEAVHTPKGLRVLEMDARLPSQTPAAVLAATGINLLREMVAGSWGKPRAGASVYEHYVVRDGAMESCGEGEFANVRAPRLERGLFGADEMITDYVGGAGEWRFTMINGGATMEAVEAKRKACLRRIVDEESITRIIDEGPGGPA